MERLVALSNRLTAVSHRAREPLFAAGFGLLYLVVAELARSLGPADASLLWAPSGLLLGVLLVSGRRMWPALLIAALAAALGANLLAGNSPAVSLAFAVPSCAEGFLGALVVLRLTGDKFSLGRVRDIAALVLGAAVITNALTALSAAAAAVGAFEASFSDGWLRWWSADALGMLVVAPAVVAVAHLAPRRTLRFPERPRLVEAGLVGAGLCAIAFFLTSAEPLGAASVVAGVAGLPLLLWAGWRFSPYGASLGTLLVALAASYLAPRTADPFGLGSIPSAEILTVQALLGMLAVGSLAFAAAAAERRGIGTAAAAGRDRLRDLIEKSPDAYVSIDDAGLISEWNPRAEADFGWTREEAVGRRLQETIVSQPGREQWKAAIARSAVVDGAGPDAVGLVAAHRSGRELPVELRMSPSSARDKSASHLFIRDVSEREQLRFELREARELLDRRAAELREREGELELAAQRAEGLGDRLAGRSEELSAAHAELEQLRADLHASRAACAQKEQELARTLERIADAEQVHTSLRDELARSHVSREEVTERLGGERAQLERALDAMVMSFAEADRERGLLARCSTELIVRYDRRGLCRYASPAARDLLGYDPAELVGQQGADLLHPDDRPALYRARSADGDTTFAARLLRKDGGLARVEVTFFPKHDPESGKLLEIEASIRRRSEEADTLPRRRTSEARFRTAFVESPVGMALLDLDGNIHRANPALCRLTGLSREKLETGGLAGLVGADQAAALDEAVRQVGTGRRARLFAEHELQSAEGTRVRAAITLAAVAEPGKEPLELVAQIAEATDRTGARDELRHLTDHDPLTGLYSPGRFEHEVRGALAAAARYDTQGAVLVANLDSFAELDGLVGRGRGDELIRAVGYALRERLRTTDVVGRIGGDQFAVLLPRAERSQAIDVANALLEAVREAGRADAGRALELTASVGIAMFGDGRPLRAEELLVEAEIAVQDAKHAGGDKTSIHDPGNDRSDAGLEAPAWADAVREAIEDDRFRLYAQPVAALNGDRLPRNELQPRMVAKGGDLVPPAAFLAAAERSGVAGDLDRWLLRSAVALIADEGPDGIAGRVEVALSSKAPVDPDLHDFVARELDAAGVDAAALCLTIPETAAIHGTDRTSLFLRRLADLGCEVGLGHFGAGVASFLHVERLPVGYVKLDGALVERLPHSQSARLIVKSIADIAHGLGMRTMADAVSEPGTPRLLGALGVGYVQGDAVSAARPVGEVDLGRPADVLRH